MIQFNLLPDVKKQYIDAKRTKRLIVSVSTMVSIASIVVVLLLFSVVQFVQKKNINDLTKDIESGIAELKSIEDLNKILTIQNQLNSLPSLHEQKPQASRLFSYLTTMTPSDISISAVKISFVESSLTIEGTAPSIASVNRYTDTVKFARYAVSELDVDNNQNSSEETNDSTGNAEENSDETTDNTSEFTDTTTDQTDQTGQSASEQVAEPEKTIDINETSTAFSDVQTELSRNESSASYKITATFDPLLFDNTKTITLVIPDTVTTRSTQGKPEIRDDDQNPLFNAQEGDN